MAGLKVMQTRPTLALHPFTGLMALCAMTLTGVGCDDGTAPSVSERPIRTAGKADRPDAGDGTVEYGFWDISGDVPMDDASSELILEAMLVIDAMAADTDAPLRAALALETFARIDAGDVSIGSVAGARGEDLWHMCKDLKHAACEGTERPDVDWEGTKSLRDAVVEDLAGYQWGNRLYFTLTDVTAEEVATTLVHEVNHVLNVSHCSYYANLDDHTVENDLAFVEEWRAFFSECVWRDGNAATAEGCDTAARNALIELEYGLSPPVELDTEVLAKALLSGTNGQLIPTSAVWPSDFNPCE
ncbi:MAG: hypothetical protein ACI9MR_004307 [Myxococcota bacterium]|jgi:hypothetical protein